MIFSFLNGTVKEVISSSRETRFRERPICAFHKTTKGSREIKELEKVGMNAIRREVERQALHGASQMPTLPLRERGRG